MLWEWVRLLRLSSKLCLLLERRWARDRLRAGLCPAMQLAWPIAGLRKVQVEFPVRSSVQLR